MLVKNGKTHKLAVPGSLQNDIIKTYHDETGHPGIDKTVTEMSFRHIWPILENDVKAFIRTCHICQIFKPNLTPKQPSLGNFDSLSAPYRMYAFDLIEPLNTTDRDNEYALVGLDLFSKRILYLFLNHH